MCALYNRVFVHVLQTTVLYSNAGDTSSNCGAFKFGLSDLSPSFCFLRFPIPCVNSTIQLRDLIWIWIEASIRADTLLRAAEPTLLARAAAPPSWDKGQFKTTGMIPGLYRITAGPATPLHSPNPGAHL
jgi:hypothetical protein